MSPRPSDLDLTTAHGDGTPSTDEDASDLRRGDVVDRYLIIGSLGEGGGGTVYRAHDPELDRTVAIKVLRRLGGEGDDRLSTRALREGKSMARLAHPNVVAVHDVGSWSGGIFIAMELVDGVDLQRWLDSEKRSQAAIVDAFVQAGEGLAAAHAQDLVHGDFKPTNVFVGNDARVRVGDFGLAREAGEAGTAAAGTPLYMAPEVHEGGVADARADQFSFCLALHAALRGQHPLENVPRAGLAHASQTLPALAPAHAPAWLRRALKRGTDPNPAQRFDTMEDLVALIRRRPEQRRRVAYAVAATMAIGATALLARTTETATSCDPSERLATTWSDDRGTALQAVIAGVGGPLGPETADRVVASADAWAERWSSTYRDVCRATHVEGVQSDAMLDVRVSCLEDNRGEVDAQLRVLEVADQAVVQRAVRAVGLLPDPIACRNAAPSGSDPVPPDPAQEGAVKESRTSLAHARALRRAGRFEDAAAAAQKVVTAADEVGYPPMAVEAQLVLGRSESGLGQYTEARETLSNAHWQAEAHRHDRVAAEAATELVYVLGERSKVPAEAVEWVPHARASITRSGDHGRIEADLLGAIGAAKTTQGEYAEALELFEQSLHKRLEVYGEGHYEVVSTRGNIGSVLDYLGRSEEARDMLQRVVTETEAALGPSHPDVARVLGNLAGTQTRLGNNEAARALYERSVAIKTAVLGADHPSLVSTMDGLGVVCRKLGDNDAARTHHEAALAIGEARLGPEHPSIAGVLINVGQLYMTSGELAAARTALERALKIQRTKYGDTHPITGSSQMALGALALEEGNADEARRLNAAARAVFVTAYGEDSLAVGLAESNLGKAAHVAGDHAGARAHFEAALQRVADAPPPRRRSVLSRMGALELDAGDACLARRYLERAHALREGSPEASEGLTQARAGCPEPKEPE
ncbi:MAG: tetratricopeptide repeat protein [Myxococcota bacterium]